MFDHLEKCFKALKRNSPVRIYFPGPTKSILAVHPKNFKSGYIFGRRHVFKVCTGARYLGVYIGDDKSRGHWIKEHTEKWDRDIFALSQTVDKYLQ